MNYSIYAGLADAEQALTYLEKAADARGMSGLLVNADPRYDTLRSHTRFQQLLESMHLGSETEVNCGNCRPYKRPAL